MLTEREHSILRNMARNDHFVIKLDDLQEISPHITPEYGACVGQACAVCLEEQGHQLTASFYVDGAIQQTGQIIWQPTTDAMRSTWNDLEDATEHGAYAVAFLLVKTFYGLSVLQKSRKGTRFDYWLGASPHNPLFQDKVRLEVSGIRRGDGNDIRARESAKTRQIQQSSVSYPGIVVIVEFSKPQSKVIFC